MAAEFPDLHPLSPEQIQEIIDDLRFVQQDDAVIYYAVDPYEIRDFCFPIDPSKDSVEADIRAIADDQAALYEVFYKQKALLLEEYAFEMRRLLDYFERTPDELRNESEMVDRLIEQGKLVWGDILPEAAEAKFLGRNFSVVLAIAMGIFSLGVKRLRDIYHFRLIKSDLNETVAPDEATLVRSISQRYERSTRTERILKQMKRPEVGENPAKRLRADEVDASAIDHLIFLNSSLNNMFEQPTSTERLSRRYLILYLSSAPKTARFFRNTATLDLLPRINQRPYNIWRTRAQLFAYAVHKSRENNVAESIANLERVRDVLEEVRKFEGGFSLEQCSSCPLITCLPMAELYVDPNCRWSDFCSKVKGLDEVIQKARSEIQNLGLINTLNDYATLRKARPQGESQRLYLDFFRNCFDSPLTWKANRRMKRLQQWILVKSEFTNSFTNALGGGTISFNQSALRSTLDFVTGRDQYLPMKPRLKSERYQLVLASILEFYGDPTESGRVVDAYARFVELDTEIQDFNAEHELIRCFLYLALPNNSRGGDAVNEGDERAYKHAEAIMVGDEFLDHEDWEKAEDWIKQEYRYVHCWTARRTGRFDRALELAEQGVAADPNDPRFFHGLCLSIYSCLAKRPKEARLDIFDAIRATETAIALYSDGIERGENNQLIAANYNNLAYFWAWSVELNRRESIPTESSIEAKNHEALDNARAALRTLNKFIDKNDWQTTKHPEFFHTEAYLEYQEFTVAMAAGLRDKARSKLENARREIMKAVKMLADGPGYDEYRSLRTRIERGLEMLG